MKLGLVVGAYARRAYVEAQGESSCVVSERASADAGVGTDAGIGPTPSTNAVRHCSKKISFLNAIVQVSFESSCLVRERKD